MAMDKKERQDKIREIINTKHVSTQEELLSYLMAYDLGVTQATISRDMKELNVIKANLVDGKQKFVVLRSQYDAGTSRLLNVFAEAVISSTKAGNLIVINTLPGMAPACASAIDVLNHPDVAGTIAGDDTLFLAVRSGAEVTEVETEIMQFASHGRKE